MSWPQTDPDDELVESIRSRVASVRDRIERSGGDSDRVKIVAVTKGLPAEHAAAALEAGLFDLGENYATGLGEKYEVIGRRARWHFLGAIQSNKVARLAPIVDCWHSIVRLVEAQAIMRRSEPFARLDSGSGTGDEGGGTGDEGGGWEGPPRQPELLVQVDTTGRAGRRGCPVEQTASLVHELRRAGAPVAGLMTVAPLGDKATRRDVFATVARLGRELELGQLSMGMSDDFEEAVGAGATMVRLGTALFGPRPPRPGLPQ